MLFGEGSVISEGLKTGFGCCANNAMEFYALPHKERRVGAMSEGDLRLTFTGPATSDGRIDLFIGDGRWNTSTRIVEGDTADDIATAVDGVADR